jgi:hypothetical protein
MNATDTFLDFVNAINAHDVVRPCYLMDADPVTAQRASECSDTWSEAGRGCAETSPRAH